MSMKKTDIEKNQAMKIAGKMKQAGVPGRFGQGASGVADGVDKREQRRLDSAAGIVPFACKLPAELIKRLHDHIAAQPDAGANAMNALVEQALTQWLAQAPVAAAKV